MKTSKWFFLLLPFVLITINNTYLKGQCTSNCSGPFFNPYSTSANYCVKLYFHIVSNSSNTGTAPASRVTQIMSQLNTAFSPHNISFYNPAPIDYFTNNDAYPYSASGGINTHSDGVDIYLHPENVSCSGGGANSVPGQPVYIALGGKLRNTNWIVAQNFVVHEMGHVLGLPHTFQTVDGVEFVARTNCTTAGDKFCDTPASWPYLGTSPCGPITNWGEIGVNFEVSASPACQWLNPKFEAGTGSPYMPNTRNFMEYTHPTCMTQFSPQQVLAMRAKIDHASPLTGRVASSVWGTIVYSGGSKALGTINYVPKTTITTNISAINTTNFTWTLTSGNPNYSTNSTGTSLYLTLPTGGAASFTIAYYNVCNLGPQSATFIHSGGFFSIMGNPTPDCFYVYALEDYNVDYIDESGATKKYTVKPEIKNIAVADDQGNIIEYKNLASKTKQDKVCLKNNKAGIYLVTINANSYDMYTTKIVKI